jgi:hypothetical protein
MAFAMPPNRPLRRFAVYFLYGDIWAFCALHAVADAAAVLLIHVEPPWGGTGVRVGSRVDWKRAGTPAR